MNTVKRWLAGLLSFAMILTCAPFSNMAVMAAKGDSQYASNKVMDSDVVATITNDAGKSFEETFRYESIANAFRDAEAGDTIVLQKDIEGNLTYSRNVHVTIDMNGHTVTGNVNGGRSSSNPGLTVTGSGKIEGDIQRVTIDGSVKNSPTVYGSIGYRTVAKGGIYYNDPSTYVTDEEGYGAVYTTDEATTSIWKVGQYKEKWDWTKAEGAAKPTVTLDLVLDETNESFLKKKVDGKTNNTEGYEDESCTESAYRYYGATATVAASDIKSNSKVNGVPLSLSTSTKADRYITKDDIKPATGHSYKASNVKFVMKDDEVVKVGDDLLYTATLTCTKGDVDPFDVEATLSTTVGNTTTFTTKDGIVYKTKTTKADPDPGRNCQTYGTYYIYTFDILDEADKTLAKDATLKYETAIEKGGHDFTYTETNVTMYWVYNNNGSEVRVPAEGISNAMREKLIAYAKANGNKLDYKTYVKCNVAECDAEQLIAEGSGTATATVIAPKATLKDGVYTVTDGGIKIAAKDFKYTYTHTDGNHFTTKYEKILTATLEGLDESADSGYTYERRGNEYYLVYKTGLFATQGAETKIEEAATCQPGILRITIGNNTVNYEGFHDNRETYRNGSTNYVYQLIPATGDHNWTFVTADDKVTGADVTGTVTIDPQNISKDNVHWVDGTNASATSDGTDGYDIYKCVDKDGKAVHYAINYKNGVPTGEPTAVDARIWANGSLISNVAVYGKDGDDTNHYQAKHYFWTVAKKGTEDDASLNAQKTELTVNYVQQYVDAETGKTESTGTEQTVIFYKGAAPGGTNPNTYIPYSLVNNSAEDLKCTEFVTYTGLSEEFGNYAYTDKTAPGKNHGKITGTVVWTDKGAATVKLVCDDCKATLGDVAKNLKISKEKTDPTCTEKGFTDYKATYAGAHKNVTLVNDTYKGSYVDALGHDVDSESQLYVKKGEDGKYAAKVYCARCEDFVDVVTNIEGPDVQKDKTRAIKVTYTNGVTKLPEYNRTVTLIDEGEVRFDEDYVLDGNKVPYGVIKTSAPYDNDLLVDGLYLENDKSIYYGSNYKVIVRDSEGKEVEFKNASKNTYLPVGKYTFLFVGIGDYAAGIQVPVEVVESVDLNELFVSLDDKVVFENYSSAYDLSTPYDGKEHKITAVACKDYKNFEYGIIDKTVSISYKVDGKDAQGDTLTFTEIGKHAIEITATKLGYKPQVQKFNFEITKAKAIVAIDNATMVEGNAPNIKYTVKDENGKALDEKMLGLKITSSAGDDLTKLRPGTYSLTATITNENYEVEVTGGIYSSGAPTLTVIANDGSTTEDQALADAAAKKINELTDASTEAQVAEARKAYDALSAKGKARIDSATLAKLVAQEDRIAATKVIDQLKKATTDDQKAAAYDAYSKLSANAKAKVDADPEAKAKIDGAKKAYDKKAADNVVSMLSKVNDNMSQADAKNIVDAYNALTADQKALVNANATAKANLTKAQKIVNRKKATYSVSKKSYTIKKPKKGKKSKKVQIKVKGKGSTKTFKKTKGKKFIKVSKKGKISVTSGAKKGTYKIKVKITAPQTDDYFKFNKTYQIKVKVK